MAMLEPVHVLAEDRATGKMECVRINPQRSFMERGDNGNVLFHWQNGKWFGTGGTELPAELIPQWCRDAIDANLPTVEQRGPSVIVTCEFCGEQMNRSERDTHLVTHVRAALAAAGTTTPAPSPLASAPDPNGKEPFVRQARPAAS